MNRFATLLGIALLVPLGTAPVAHADTQYAGSALHKGTALANPHVSLIHRDNGTVAVRAVVSFSCKRVANTALVLRGSGRLSGANFDVRLRKRIPRMGTVSVRVTGAVSPGSVSGEARLRIGSCVNLRRPLVLRTESAPAGAAALPAPGTIAQGMSSQSAAGFRMPVTLRVAKNGRVYAVWSAMLKCRRSSFAMLDQTPSRAIRPDGTFGGTQTYTVRYRGVDERYRVSFRGQFTADGVRGTLTASMRFVDGKNRYIPCRSGRQTWAARAT